MNSAAANDIAPEHLGAIIERWFLQSTARQIVLDRTLLNLQTLLHGGSGNQVEKLNCGRLPRIAHCCRTVTGEWAWNEAVHVVKKGKGDRTRYGYDGVQTCGSWSACPICAPKIANRRRKEILAAVKGWGKGSVVMLTLTAPHVRSESLNKVRTRFMAARRVLRQQTVLKRDPGFMPYSALRSRYGIEGGISALEVTFSDQNGWHFHSHELLFSNQDLSREDLVTFEVKTKLAWFKACGCVNISIPDRFAFFLHSCRVSLTDRKAANYLSKFGDWTAADELTKSHSKKGKSKSLTPWDFLRLANDSASSYKKYGLLFLEVVSTFFGKQQIFFEKGFKKKLGLQEMTDQEILESGLEVGESQVYGILGYCEWRKICAVELRGLIISKCAAGESWDSIKRYLGVQLEAIKVKA